jgi:predicted nuclease with TOPRIM domain
MAEVTHESLKVEIDNMKEDIKEIKFDQKETNKYFREVIGELKENSIRQTEILNKVTEQQHTQNEQQKIQFDKVNEEIADLNQKIDSNMDAQNINTNKLFKGILRELGVAALTILVMYLLYRWGISGGIQH